LNPPLRIALLLNPFTSARTGGDHAPELARELAVLGHTVRVFGPTQATTSKPSGTDSTEAATDPSAGDTAEAPLEALVPRRFAPDAIVAYDAHSPAAMLGARTARALSIPLILVEAGARTERGRISRLYHGATEMLWGRYVRRTASALVALDPLARKRALVGGFPEDRVVTLAPGVDPEDYQPGLVSSLIQRHRIRGRILLYVGRIERNRGLDVLVRAFERTVGQRDDWSLVLVGEGSARADLRATIDRLGIGARVHWLGRVRSEELAGLFSSCTLLAVPSLDDSVRGRNVVRAMSCGRPVLVSDRPNLRTLVQHEVTGLVVPPGDVEAWTEALQRAAMSPDARRRWGRRAREVAGKRFSWGNVAQVFESMIRIARGDVPGDSPAGSRGRNRSVVGNERGLEGLLETGLEGSGSAVALRADRASGPE
jgi:glycogen(starch) synthase